MNICKKCGRCCQGEYCFYCKPKKPLAKNKKNNIENVNKMHKFFMSIWRKRKEHKCENCKIPLGNEPLSYMFDHLLEKSKYPELKYEEDNIFLTCLMCHDKKTRGFITEIVKERINFVKEKYYL
jgi:hypothetical protein